MKTRKQTRWLKSMVANCFISDLEIRGRRRLFFRRPRPYKGPGKRARAIAALKQFNIIVETIFNNDGTYTHIYTCKVIKEEKR